MSDRGEWLGRVAVMSDRDKGHECTERSAVLYKKSRYFLYSPRGHVSRFGHVHSLNKAYSAC